MNAVQGKAINPGAGVSRQMAAASRPISAATEIFAAIMLPRQAMAKPLRRNIRLTKVASDHCAVR